jgi:hypothetical protein
MDPELKKKDFLVQSKGLRSIKLESYLKMLGNGKLVAYIMTCK